MGGRWNNQRSGWFGISWNVSLLSRKKSICEKGRKANAIFPSVHRPTKVPPKKSTIPSSPLCTKMVSSTPSSVSPSSVMSPVLQDISLSVVSRPLISSRISRAPLSLLHPFPGTQRHTISTPSKSRVHI